MSNSRAAKTIFLLAASPVIWRAAWRARGAIRRYPLDEATRRLAAAPRWRFAWFNRPQWLAGAVDRWLPVLPPAGHGACLRRSLVLLDLWSRCGLEPRLYLGMAHDGDTRAFHAWVEGREIAAGRSPQWTEIWNSRP